MGASACFSFEHTRNDGCLGWVHYESMNLLEVLLYIAWSCAFPGVDHGYSVFSI
jgi:hypothetical protein